MLQVIRKTPVLIAAAALAALTATGAMAGGKYNKVLAIGDPMPPFKELPGIDGGVLSSSDIDSDIVVMVSLANHCPWVKGMDADLVKLAQANEGKSVTIVGFGVNLREDDRLEANV